MHFHSLPPWFFVAYAVLAWIIALSMVLVVLRRQFAPGAGWAWLGIVFLHPYVGLALYLLVGETRLKPGRAALHRQIAAKFRGGSGGGAIPDGLHPVYQPMVLQAEKIGGLPIRSGNGVQYIDESPRVLDRLVADIDAASTRVHVLYYIFAPDPTGERLVCALERAAGRGVKCRVLVDAVASRKFFRRQGFAKRLGVAKVQVAAALPVAASRRGLPRMDLRNHRKLTVIDDRIAYAGSHNIINADYDGKCGGPWVDLTGRFTGPIVAEFQGVFQEDWAFETGEFLDAGPSEPPANVTDVADSDITMQVVPTGPGTRGETYRRLLLGAVQSARSRLVLTTPYFVPDEPTLVALMMAADRGVDVQLIVPEHPDHAFTAAAGRAHFGMLMDAGIRIFLYTPGMLHSKTTTVDDAFVLFGSANLDVRSFNLNFELSVLLYGGKATAQMREIQEKYLGACRRLDKTEWAARSALRRYADGAICLLSPLL